MAERDQWIPKMIPTITVLSLSAIRDRFNQALEQAQRNVTTINNMTTDGNDADIELPLPEDPDNHKDSLKDEHEDFGSLYPSFMIVNPSTSPLDGFTITSDNRLVEAINSGFLKARRDYSIQSSNPFYELPCRKRKFENTD
jgi:hypothetical protein